MGFSPGDFKTKQGEILHVEAGGSGVNVWNDNESDVKFTLDFANARLLRDHLSTALSAVGED